MGQEDGIGVPCGRPRLTEVVPLSVQLSSLSYGKQIDPVGRAEWMRRRLSPEKLGWWGGRSAGANGSVGANGGGSLGEEDGYGKGADKRSLRSSKKICECVCVCHTAENLLNESVPDVAVSCNR